MVGATCLDTCGLHHTNPPGQVCLVKSKGGGHAANHEDNLDALVREKAVLALLQKEGRHRVDTKCKHISSC